MSKLGAVAPFWADIYECLIYKIKRRGKIVLSSHDRREKNSINFLGDSKTKYLLIGISFIIAG